MEKPSEKLTFAALPIKGDFERVVIPIVRCSKNSISYRIPSFPVITVELRLIRYQGYLTDDQVKVVDGFIRDDPSLQQHTFPTQVIVGLNSTTACLLEVRLFSYKLQKYVSDGVLG